MPFDSPDVNLGTLLTQVHEGKVQLPDFQREWKWDHDRIASLLASISLDHPVGVLMMLEVGGPDVRLQPRRIAGAPDDGAAPERLMLDGQQRVTSLYQALRSGNPVATVDARNKAVKRWYYVDIERALAPDADREEAILSVPEDRIVRADFGRRVDADYRTTEQECRAEVFPLRHAFDMPSVFRWQNAYVSNSLLGPERAQERWNALLNEVLDNFIHYTVPVIVLTKETPKEAVCTVFEKVNTGGVVLNVFELLTATYAADDFALNKDWAERRERLRDYEVLDKLESTDFLQAISLVSSWHRRQAALLAGRAGAEPDALPAVLCRRKDILALPLEAYRRHAEAVTAGFEWAAQFLAREKIFAADDVPYRTQLVPLAALRVVIGARIDEYAIHESIRRWYWCGVLGELYSGATETRFARDVEHVPLWIEGGPTPRTIVDASFEATRLESLRTRNSAAYKGVHALLMKHGARDWLKPSVEIDLAQFFDLHVDIHHVFPRKWCDDHGIERELRDSIVNKTPLSYDTNRSIGGRPPSAYVQTLDNKGGGRDAVDDRLAAHLIDPAHLRSDDFDAFFDDRRERLVQLISAAMGKPVTRDDLEDAEGPDQAPVDGALGVRLS